ncbi:succinate dehydrogenase [Parenemella sanctibonifatiensis]|uniref:Succinate dehydrogenase n=2 Tax=Parenemella sanctibonifatiensis TaxID=2016505 RepID=A0A255EKU2_9ACTN|nr:succinate dehydrogenase [Parenemella sanctibonifatiensis]
MATGTLTTHQRAVRSSVAMKALMAITGLILIGFLLGHMAGNLKALAGQDAFNEYSHHLRVFLYPILPEKAFLWTIRIVLLAAVLLHMYSAAVLSGRLTKRRGPAYQHKARVQQSYASRTMRWGGVIIALFVIFHLLHFTAEIITPGFEAPTDPFSRVIGSFGLWWVFVIYLIAMVAVCLHVQHGFWSAFATLGANVSPGARRIITTCAWVCAALLFIGFLIPPTLILTGVIAL